jgi:hypothetical protein
MGYNELHDLPSPRKKGIQWLTYLLFKTNRRARFLLPKRDRAAK